MQNKHYLTLRILGIIPARYESSRFPGKPLAHILGKTMIQRVYEQCQKSELLSAVYVATDAESILENVQSFQGNVILTAKHHENGTSRCNEVIHQLKQSKIFDYEYVINIQGDEPFIQPQQIDELCALLLSHKCEIASQVKMEFQLAELANPNIVKAILDEQNFAIDFKREIDMASYTLPYFYKHIGLYGFKQDILEKLVALEPTENEHKYKLEQLRWLDHQYKIKMGVTMHESISIDTKEDLERAIEKFSE